MRASDQDRQRTVEELRRHCAAGRIDVDEYAARIERALSAATLEELDDIRADLPMLRIAEPAGGGVWAGRRGRGRQGLPAVAAVAAGAEGADGRTGVEPRLLALAVAAITVAVVLAAVLVSLLAEWTWAVALVVGWVAGVIQGRLARSPGRNR